MHLRVRLLPLTGLLVIAASCSRTDSAPKNQNAKLPTSVSDAAPKSEHVQILSEVPAAGSHGLSDSHDQAHTAQTKVETAKANESALILFDKRILPIFQSAKPSSCSECHLSGVDLKEYIRPTQQETFVSLVSAGMIDVKKPDDSKILRSINRIPKTPSLVALSEAL